MRVRNTIGPEYYLDRGVADTLVMPRKSRLKGGCRQNCLPHQTLCHAACQFQGVGADAFVGEADDEAGALARGAFDFDLAVVSLDDPGDETEAEAEALFGSGRGSLAGDAVEAVDDMRQR